MIITKAVMTGLSTGFCTRNLSFFWNSV